MAQEKPTDQTEFFNTPDAIKWREEQEEKRKKGLIERIQQQAAFMLAAKLELLTAEQLERISELLELMVGTA